MGGGVSGTHTTLGELVPRYSSIRIQTSAQGVVIPVVFGTTRVAGNFLWMDDFGAIYHEKFSSQAGVGKGGGSGPSSSKEVSYTYHVAFIMGICEGPTLQLTRLWASGSKINGLPGSSTLFKGTYPQPPWSYLTANHPDKALNYPGLSYIGAPNYNLGSSTTLPGFSFELTGLLPWLGVPINLNFDLISNGDFSNENPPIDWDIINYPGEFLAVDVTDPEGNTSKAAHITDIGWGGFQQPISETINGHIYTLSFWYKVISGRLSAGIRNDAYEQVFPDFEFNPADQEWYYYEKIFTENLAGTEGLRLRFYNTIMIGYADFYIWNVKLTGSEIVYDAEPGEIINNIITDQKYGLGLPNLVDIGSYSAWCIAMGFFLSPAFISQALASEHIQVLLDETFATCIWHDGSILKIIPYGDTQVIGNGVTWNPEITPRYDLADDDFIIEGDEEPIQVSRKSPADCYNDIKIECWNRDNEYNIEIAEVWDQASIDSYMTRSQDSRTMHDICNPVQATTLAYLILQRSVGIRNTYRFKLGWKHCLLESMDVVTLTDSALGMDKTPVRITNIEEDENYINTITAEEFKQGIGSSAIYERQESSPYIPDLNKSPGPVISPLIFLAPAALWTDPSKPEIWVAASGSSVFGGCDIYLSSDDASYAYAGTILGRPRIGTLTSPLPSGSDPDSVNTCPVDIATSRGELLSGTQVDADNLITLCAILDGEMELISYQTATLTASYKYDLTYLRRGSKGSQISSHPAGSRFLRLDNLVLKIPIDSIWLHTMIYFKFCTFNIWKSGLQSISDVVAYPFVIQSPIADVMWGTDSVTVGMARTISDTGQGTDSISVSK